jgi:hypothetical protein
VKQVVRVASGQGFWGDWLEAPRRQVEGGPVDYLMLDYLAEVTMSILQKQKERDPRMGYARDFLGAIESVLPAIVDRGVRVIANAGGVNPVACAEAVRALAASRGAGGKVKIGVVTGDDLLPRIDALIAGGHPLVHMETGEPLATVRDRVLSANAYIGSTPIVEALGRGAQVVITGRSTDTRSRWRRFAMNSAGRLTTGTGWPRASSPDTSSSAARSAPVAIASSTGATFRISRTSDTRSSAVTLTARSRSTSTRIRVAASPCRRSPTARVRDGRSARVHHA